MIPGGGLSVEQVTSAAGHVLDVLFVGLVFLVGLEVGVRRGGHLTASTGLSPLQRFVKFWLGGSDGRVNYTRATAFFGLVGYCTITIVVLHKYESGEKPELEPLVITLVASLAMLGINLGQYGIASVREVKMVQANNPQPPAPAPPQQPMAGVQVNVGDPPTPPAAPGRRDSGLGATQVLPATPPDRPIGG